MQLIISLMVIAIFIKLFGTEIAYLCVFGFSIVNLHHFMSNEIAVIVSLIISVAVYFGGKELKKYEK